MSGKWQVTLGEEWKDLEFDAAKAVAIAEGQGQLQCVLLYRGFRYTLDLQTMTQTNHTTGRVRSLRKVPSSAVEMATPTESEIAPCPIRLEVSLKTELKGIDADAHEVGLAPAAVVSGVSAGDRVVGSGRLRPTGAYRSSRARIPIRSDQLPRRKAPALPAASDGMMDSHLASEGDRSDHEPESTPPEGI